MSSRNWQPFCLGFSVLKAANYAGEYDCPGALLLTWINFNLSMDQ